MKLEDVQTVDDLKNFAAENLATSFNIPKYASKEDLRTAGSIGMLEKVVKHQEESHDDIVGMTKRIRESFNSNKTLWNEVLIELRQIRMAVTVETAGMNKAIADLVSTTDKVNALANALERVKKSLSDPILAGVLK